MNPKWILMALILASCGEGTTGKRVVLHTRITSDLPADHTVVTSSGWSITLEAAAISTGALYYFDGEPAFTQRAPVRPNLLEQFIESLAPIQAAYAHPGHYVAGNAKGEQLESSSADLLAGAAPLPDGDGVSGPFRSATFSLAVPTAGPATTVLDGNVAMARGTATKGGKTVHFLAVATLAEIEKTAKDGAITGCIFHEADVQAEGTVTITVHPRVWFSLIDFSVLAEGTAEAPTLLAADSTERIAFALGLTQLSAYDLAYSTP